MTGIVIVSVVSLLVVVDVFRLFTRRTTISRTGMLVGAIARAAIPMAAALAIGIWQLITSFEHIAETGSGGLKMMAAGPEQLIRALLGGVIGFAVVLTVALVMVVRTQASKGAEELRSSRQKVMAALGTVVVMASLGVVWMTMNWADRFGVGMLGPMLRPGVAAPPALPVKVFPEPPPGYTMIASGQEMARQSGRLITSRAVAIGLCVLLVGLSLATPAVFSGLPASGAAWNLARGGVAALVLGAVWYSMHLGTGAGWLRAVIDR